MGKYIPPKICTGTWDLSADNPCGKSDSDLAENLAAETIEIAGAPINIFKLLGIYNQGSTIDLTENGYPLSSGSAAGYNISDAFNTNPASWLSVQTGIEVVTTPSFIGYNFGNKLNNSGLDRYAPPQPIRFHITTLKIKQGADPNRRVIQARIEKSDDGISWNRVDVVNLPNSENLETISLKQSAPAQQWRIVPLLFNGVSSNDSWEIESLEMLEETQTSLDTVQDSLLLENRDRDYSHVSVRIKAHYDLIDVQTELSKFGIDLPTQYMFTVSFAKMVELIGRPLVIGDIVELPSEAQYDFKLNTVKKWLEITDTGWSTEGYTPGWRPVLFRFFAQPLLATQENREIMGSAEKYKNLTDSEFLIDDVPINISNERITENIIVDSDDAVPETGSDAQDIQSAMPLLGPRGGYDGQDLYVEDGMPPNNESYTEGLTWPTSPNDGDYHRIIYEGKTKIPPKLFKWSAIKHRWIYLETDRRGIYTSHKPSIANVLKSTNKKNLDDKL